MGEHVFDIRQRTGVVLLVCGLSLLVIASSGVDYLMADRTATITVVADPDAYLGIVDNSGDSSADITGQNDTGNIYFLDDNANAFADASAFTSTVLRVDYNETTDTDPGLSATIRNTGIVEGLTTSHEYVLQIECKDDVSDQGIGYVTVAITGTGDDIVNMERTTNQTVSIDCT